MIPVLWVPQESRGSWDMGQIEEWTSGPEFVHSPLGSPPKHVDGAVVVLAGQHCLKIAEECAETIAAFDWALTIVVSDEEALFPVQSLPRDQRHLTWGAYHARPEFDRVIPIGLPPDSEFNCVGTPGPSLFFAGQNTHARREELLDVMKEMAGTPGNGDIGWIATTGFRAGLERFDYKLAMCFARAAPCPSGYHSLDSFRLYEAIAAGCVPIIETHTPDGEEGDFWTAMFGTHPIPTVKSWDQLPAIAPLWTNVDLWNAEVGMIRDWYAGYRERLARDFAATIARLQS